MVDLSQLGTERQNPKTLNLDEMSIHELLSVMNEEDLKTVQAVHEALPQIEEAVRYCIASLKKGGRIIYMGAGTSGRIGVMDAVECLPTFSSEQVIALMAGGEQAFVRAREGAEDSRELGKQDLIAHQLEPRDTVIGLAASGRTPYVIGGLDYASSIGASTVSVACNRNAEISMHAGTAIEVDAGPEVLTGSTRLKAGTCEKMICNMISTASMTGIGKVYGNLMVDMKPTNEKLKERAVRMVMKAADTDRSTAEKALEQADNSCKTAIVMVRTGTDQKEAESLLNQADGFVRKAIAGKE